MGIRPDIIVGRSNTKLEEDIATKIAFFADIPRECVISAPDARSIYDVPMVFLEQKLPELVEKRLGLKSKKPDLTKSKDFADRISNGNKTVEIALIGKYTDLKDSYISHEESLRYAGALLDCKVKIRWSDKHYRKASFWQARNPHKIWMFQEPKMAVFAKITHFKPISAYNF